MAGGEEPEYVFVSGRDVNEPTGSSSTPHYRRMGMRSQVEAYGRAAMIARTREIALIIESYTVHESELPGLEWVARMLRARYPDAFTAPDGGE